jgi:hypothetical protein
MTMSSFTLKDFVDAGLLFEINRQVLHPLGLAMAVQQDTETGEILGFAGFQDSRDDPEGIIFDAEDFAEARARHQRYLDERGSEALRTRETSLGFCVQGPGDVERLDAARANSGDKEK